MPNKKTKESQLDLEQKIIELEKKLGSQQELNEEKTAIMKKTIAETEHLARHLQNTTLALIQERQVANAKAEKEKLVNQWVKKINASFDLDSLSKIIVEELAKFLSLDRCGILLFQGTNILEAIEYTNDDFKRISQSKNFNDINFLSLKEIKNSYLYQQCISEKNKVIDNVLKLTNDTLLDDVQSLMAFPITVFTGDTQVTKENISEAKNVFGMIYFQHCASQKEWQETEIDIVSSIINPLAVSIEKSLLYSDSKKRTKYAELLNSLTTQIRSSLNLSEILARTVNELGIALQASRCFLYFDGYISDEYSKHCVPPIADKMQHLIFDKFVNQGDLGSIAINDIYQDFKIGLLSDEEKKELEISKAAAALACPLHFQGILQGWIVFHDFEKRIWSQDEIAFVEAAAAQVMVAMTQSRMYEKLNSYQEKLSRELKQAARVQTALIGGDVFDVSLETSVFYKAHSNVSGDFYWVAELAPDVIGVLIGDVSGKGPAAALLTGYLLGEFNAAIANSALPWFPEKMISFLCQSILYQNASSDFYATAWYGVFDLHNKKLKYTNAGHLNPYLIKDGQVTELGTEDDCGVPLGLINPKELEEVYIAREIDFVKGDKMLLFTDGVLDQKMPDGNFVPKNWIYDRLQKIKDKDVKDITFDLNEILNSMSGSTPLSDDRLMISLEGVDFDFQEFTCGQVEDINKLIDTIVHDCIEHHLPKERQIEFKLGITEALSNAVRHGPLDHDVNKTIKIGYRIDNGHFKMSIIDSGPGFNWQVYNYASIDDVFEDSEGGRGIPLLLEIFDKVTWNYLGNHIGLFFYW